MYSENPRPPFPEEYGLVFPVVWTLQLFQPQPRARTSRSYPEYACSESFGLRPIQNDRWAIGIVGLEGASDGRAGLRCNKTRDLRAGELWSLNCLSVWQKCF